MDGRFTHDRRWNANFLNAYISFKKTCAESALFISARMLHHYICTQPLDHACLRACARRHPVSIKPTAECGWIWLNDADAPVPMHAQDWPNANIIGCETATC